MPQDTKLVEAVAKAEVELKLLRTQEAGIQRRVADAVRTGRDDQALKLQRERDELPTRIATANIRLLTARIAVSEAQIVEAETELEPLADAQQQARNALDEAQRAFERAFAANQNARAGVRGDKADVAALRRELNGLAAETAKDRGNVVRTLVGLGRR